MAAENEERVDENVEADDTPDTEDVADAEASAEETPGGNDDDLEAQMAAAMAAEGLGEGENEGGDDDDLEAQMAAAMNSDDAVGDGGEEGDEPGGGDLLEDSLAGGFDGGDEEEPVPVQQAQFQQLRPSDEVTGRENIERLMDVSLNLAVELGRKNMQIKEILDLGPGKIIELDKLAGEPVDLLVNGRLLAKGEVVVVDENFGVRITDLIDPRDRIRSL